MWTEGGVLSTKKFLCPLILERSLRRKKDDEQSSWGGARGDDPHGE